MPTPFLEYTNCRMRFPRPTAGVVSLRDGPEVTTEIVAVEAVLWFQGGAGATQFLGGTGKSGEAASSTALGSQEQPCKGYVTRWAVVPADENWLAAGLAWSWDTSGLAPGRLLPSKHPLDVYHGPISRLPDTSYGQMGKLRLTLVGSEHGTGGIGEMLIAETGSKLLGLWTTLT